MEKLSLKEIIDKYANLEHHADIEAKGFWEVVHTTEDIWCLCSVVIDPDTGEDVVLLFHDYPEYDNVEVWDEHDKMYYTIPERNGTLMEGFRLWYSIGQSEEGILAVHNCATYDQPIIEKVMPKCKIPDHKWFDTFIQSKIALFDRTTPKGAKSPHGLKAYGIMNGINKPDINDWTTMDAYKLHRVIEDVKIQKKTTEYLRREAQALKIKFGIDLTEAYEMEYQYAKSCHDQEVFGALADVEHMKRCVEEWDKVLYELETDIEPRLPPTVKPTGTTKVTRREMAELLGYPDKVVRRIPIPMVTKKLKGEMVEVPVKPYAKPTTKFTLDKKTATYSGMNISHGFSPTFVKKTELTKWIKENHPDTKPKEWDIEKGEAVNKTYDAKTAKYFEIDPLSAGYREIRDENDQVIDYYYEGMVIGAYTRIKFEASRLTQHEIVKGELIKAGIKFSLEWNFKTDSETGKMVKATEDMVVSYPKKASYQNQLHMTVKKGEPIVTSPIFGDKEMDQVEGSFGKDIAHYNTLSHRRRFLSNPKDPENKGLLAAVRPDGRLPCGVGNFGTATGRAAHRVWVNAAGGGSLYGEEIRRCIIAPEGTKLVSSDMNSAQLSIAAYYANNFDYFKAVCYGNEFRVDEKGNEILHPDTGKPWYLSESGHCTNSRAFELFSKEDSDRAVATQDQELIHKLGLLRKKSKGATFGVIFGCSGKKLALMLGIDEELGNRKKKAFLENIGLDRPIAILEEMCEKNKRGKYGYIELPFGYYAACSSPHARFNYLDLLVASHGNMS
ncbi:ribonuclease H-like domain protein [Vibrio phage 1.121.O._10N.286.46.C4]|nr:ribonuclease H-like domain protein [Vibrio phage 1.121.O._10N.286.46.C4]